MIKHWISAFRLKTLPLSFSSILVGNFLGFTTNGFNWSILILSLITTLFLQILSNLANDLGDALKGTDNESRIGPERAIQSGSISINQMKKAVVIFSFLSLFSGVTLLISSFEISQFYWIISFLILGLGAIAAAIFYTMGKNPYGYRALGDIFVLIFFGWVGVLGSNFLQTQEILLIDILPATSIGLLAIGVLNMNNIRDLKSDKLSGKITIPVLLGNDNAKKYHSIIIILSLALLLFYSLYNFKDWWQYLYLLTSFPLFLNIRFVKNNKVASELNPELKRVALTTFFISITLSITLIFSKV